MVLTFTCSYFTQHAFMLPRSFISNSLKHKALNFQVGTDFSFRTQLIYSFFNCNIPNFWVSLTFCIELVSTKSLCVQFTQLSWFITKLVYIGRPCFYSAQFNVIYKSPLPVLNYGFQIQYWYHNLRHSLFSFCVPTHWVSDERHNSILVLIFMPRVHQSTDSTISSKI